MSLKTVFAIGVGVCLFIKVNAQATVIDSGNIQTNSSEIVYKQVIANKSKYIGKPLDSLFKDIKVEIEFSRPDNQGRRRAGAAYYQDFLIFLPWKKGDAIVDFRVKIQNKVFISIENMIELESKGSWEKTLKTLLRNQIVTDILQ